MVFLRLLSVVSFAQIIYSYKNCPYNVLLYHCSLQPLFWDGTFYFLGIGSQKTATCQAWSPEDWTPRKNLFRADTLVYCRLHTKPWRKKNALYLEMSQNQHYLCWHYLGFSETDTILISLNLSGMNSRADQCQITSTGTCRSHVHWAGGGR